MKCKKRMYRPVALILSVVALLFILQTSSLVLAADGIAIDANTFPDEVFRSYVAENFDVDKDGILSKSECDSVKMIDVIDRGIASLKGIEYFTALTELSCGSNALTSLDISKNTALTELFCEMNKLTALDVRKNTALTLLSCHQNKLTSLDVSKNTKLTGLACFGNELTKLDVSKNTALIRLSCNYNQLTSLDVSKNTALYHLVCDNNRLGALDVSKNDALTELVCDSNTYILEASVAGRFKLSKIPGFDVSRASNWQGCTIDGNILVPNEGVTEVTYLYQVAPGNSVEFKIKLEKSSVNLALIISLTVVFVAAVTAATRRFRKR